MLLPIELLGEERPTVLQNNSSLSRLYPGETIHTHHCMLDCVGYDIHFNRVTPLGTYPTDVVVL